MNISKPVDLTHYKAIIALFDEAVLVLSRDGTILASNPAMSKVLKLPLQAIEGQNLISFSALTDATVCDFLRSFARSSHVYLSTLLLKTDERETRITVKGARLPPLINGQTADLLLRFIPRSQSQHKFNLLNHKITQLNQEMAERQHAQYKLRSQKEWLETTLFSIADGVIITDSDGNIIMMNAAAERITQRAFKENMGAPLNSVFVILDINSRQVETPTLPSSVNHEASAQVLDTHLLVNQIGSEVAVQYTYAPIGINEEIQGGVLIFRDVTEERKLQQQLRDKTDKLVQAGRHTENYLVMLAHELRNPLAPILNALQIMELSTDKTHKNCELLEVIRRQTQHLKRLVDDMLDVSRISQGKVNVTLQAQDLTEIIKASVMDYTSQFESVGISLSHKVPLQPAWVKLDSVRIAQVISNLLVNAKKFTPKGGKVSVNLSVEENQAFIRIKDTGIGIDAELLPVVFEPFTQGKQKLDRTQGGLGLGLALVKGIIELHDGSVSAHSAYKGKDKGTEFVLTLPLCSATQNHEAITPAISQGHQAKTQRVLLIEDNLDSGSTLLAIMKLLGYQTRWEKNGVDGLATAKEYAPSLIICDIGLPDIDGLEVAARLNKDKKTASIPIIALSGYSVANINKQLGESLFAEHLLKPTSVSDIQNAIHKVLPKN